MDSFIFQSIHSELTENKYTCRYLSKHYRGTISLKNALITHFAPITHRLLYVYNIKRPKYNFQQVTDRLCLNEPR